MNRLVRYYIKFLYYVHRENDLFIKFKDKDKMFLFKYDKNPVSRYCNVTSVFLKDNICHRILVDKGMIYFYYIKFDYDDIDNLMEKYILDAGGYILTQNKVQGDRKLEVLNFKLEDFDEGDITKEVMIYGKKYLDIFEIYLPQEFCDLMDQVLDNPNIDNHFAYQDDEYYDYITGI